MREMKFRAWNKKYELMKSEKDLIYLDAYIAPDGKVFTFESANEPYSDKDCMMPQPDLILMQFTGLLDKNGKEIYEGDIVVPDRPPYCQGLSDGDPVVIGWLECGGWYPFADNMDGEVYPKPEKSEVIGTIYENPELLEDKT